MNNWTHGGDLGGTVPQNLIWGTAHASVPPPNILRSSVKGCAEKYEVTKKRRDGGILCVK